ncbi:MAG: hypothetical protein EAY65_03920 [Alphaproteobacteria bacterium]|nr:MAG: hypothetical protein EAY65_03920 [Alphaproteobacteria bacterium]
MADQNIIQRVTHFIEDRIEHYQPDPTAPNSIVAEEEFKASLPIEIVTNMLSPDVLTDTVRSNQGVASLTLAGAAGVIAGIASERTPNLATQCVTGGVLVAAAAGLTNFVAQNLDTTMTHLEQTYMTPNTSQITQPSLNGTIAKEHTQEKFDSHIRF